MYIVYKKRDEMFLTVWAHFADIGPLQACMHAALGKEAS